MKYIIKYTILLIGTTLYAEPLYFCTAADSTFFPHLLNLIGSIHKVNYDDLGEISVFNLGMTQEQIDTLTCIEKLTVHEVEKVHPDIIKPVMISYEKKYVPGWYAWKPVAIKQALDMFPYALWIDAGSTVLKPLNILFKHIQQQGYFLGTIGMPNTKYTPLRWSTTKYVIDLFDLNNPSNQWILDQDSVMGNIIGITAACKDLFITPLYKLAHEMRAFIDDGTTEDGFGCARHDQALLGVIAYSKNLRVFSQDAMQVTPIDLTIDGNKHPFNITWHGHYVCDKTHIYSSRHDLGFFQHYCNYIRYRDGFIVEPDARTLGQFAAMTCSLKATLNNSYLLAQECIRNNIFGDFIDCGVAAGGHAAAMAYVSQKYGAKRTIRLFSEFNDGLSNVDVTSLEAVTENMRRWGVNTENLLTHKGLLEHTLAQFSANIGTISLLRLDGNSYSVTKICLESLYHKLARDGYIVIDNYDITGSRQAVDEYVQTYNLKPNIIPVKDSHAVYWQINDACMVSHISSYPYITGDTFRAACDHHIDLTTKAFDVNAIKRGDSVYVHGDIIGLFLTQVHPYIKNKYILVTHNSDIIMPGLYKSVLDDPKLEVWFALNPGQVHPKLKPLPIGHANKFCPSGVTQIIDQYAQAPWKIYGEKKGLLYMNFKVINNSAKRQLVQDLFEHNGMCKQSEPKPFGEFFAEMSQYKFTLSPEGAGPDCHRTWEALLVGSIPIVLSSPLDSLFDDLPVLIINKWEDVTSEFLEKKYQEMMKKHYKREKLYVSYWLDQILSEKKRLLS